MIEDNIKAEVDRRIEELDKMLARRVRQYPYTWHRHADIELARKEYLNLTGNPIYENAIIKNDDEDKERRKR